ncbi:MAG: OmpH family outer membrane protein [Planctomycetaceae bacterium]
MYRRLNNNSFVAALLAALLGYSWAQRSGTGDDAERKEAELPIAVVDLARVFQAYKPLTDRREEHAREVRKADEAVKGLMAEVARLNEDLKGVKEGSAEHRRLVEEIQKKRREFETFRQQEQQRLIRLESELFAHAYDRVVEEVQKYADAHNLRLVLRHHGGSLDGKNPQETIAGLNRLVLYQNALEITDEIISAMN